MSVQRLLSCFFVVLSLMSCQSSDPGVRWALVIHGGAGGIDRDHLTPELQTAYHEALGRALAAGEEVLRAGGPALDAVTESIRVMEDSPLFNAGRGAVFTHEGRNELDASIMDGRDLDAGAVAGVTTVKNPILAARAVMEHSPHVMLAGVGADSFASAQNLETVPPEYFHTDRRWQDLQRVQARDIDVAEVSENGDWKFGTVGAVAMDLDGNLVAGTSTGGMTNKRWGRIGDSPVIGAGTYADNASCAVSATGHGEFFIRRTVARDICARVEYLGEDLQQSAHKVVGEQLVTMGGSGGVIAVDSLGNMVMEFNSSGMFRGSVSSAAEAVTAMFGD